MRNKYTIFLLSFVLALACMYATPVWAEGSGLSCGDPIEMGRSYNAHISGPDTVWYVANTFDLPLTVKYYPNDSKAAPDLYLDFSCTPGVYDDSIICSLFCMENAIVPMPYHITPAWKLDENNHPYYEVAMGEWYRNVLLEHGISYNVAVYIKAVYYGVGDIELTPDAEFSQCMETEDWLLFDRELPVAADDGETFFIAPYANWADDSVRYIWRGTEPALVVFGTTCKFDPTDDMDDRRIDVMNMKAGRDTVKHTNEDITYYMTYMTNPNNTAKGGIFYVKVFSEDTGTLKVERIPATPPGGDATLLKYGEAVNVYSNDTSRLYAIPSSWVKDLRFMTPTDHIFKMYVGTTPSFTLEDAFASYRFDKTDSGHELRLFAAEMSSLQARRLGNENYLYIRFQCADNTTVKPMLWTPSDCEKKAKRIKIGQQFDVAAKSDVIYSLYYEELRGGEMSVAWTSMQTTCSLYIADTCVVPNSSSGRVFYVNTVPKNGRVTCPQETVDSWASYVDPDGYLYVRFYSQGKAKITVNSTAPEETDPICNPYDSILAVTAWDSCEWKGTVYKESGIYTKDGNMDPETGCLDTLFTLALTIHKTNFDAQTLTGCDTIEFGGKAYTEGGDYVDTTFTSAGDRIITALSLTIRHSSSSDTAATVCGALEWHGKWYDASGDYNDTLLNIAGCDSVRTLHLTVYEQPENVDTTAVVWDSLVWNGTTYKQSGDYPIEMKDMNGCDYWYTLHLTVHTTAYDIYTETRCDSIVYNGKKYTVSGEYKDTVLAEDGNRTITTLSFTIAKSSLAEVNVVVYEPYLSPSGKTYTEDGDYIDTIANIAGCDSIITTHLTMKGTTSVTLDPLSGCDRIEYEGKTYTQSGTYSDTTYAVDGHRTITSVTMTIGHTTYGEESIYKKGSYTSPRGNVYTESGDYTETVTNIAGCDSIITLHITIGHVIYDTVYFCRGYNREHEEQINEILIRRYLPYTYEAPLMADYREGVVIEINDRQALVNFHQAESNLRNHYTNGLTPIESITWSIRYSGQSGYTPIVVAEAQPQWIDMGTIAVQIMFRCGEVYNNAFPMGVEETEVSGQVVKRIMNGQVVIVRGGAVYTLMGQRIGNW
ncbi:MAG: hypothetical protein IJQ32_08340 [Paludibacteraceae bacterium]|nr:hypothetical protein [Paludibacteraceae bacterium]